MLKGDEVSFKFESRNFPVHETIIWCTDETKQHRSNQVTVRTSGEHTALTLSYCYDSSTVETTQSIQFLCSLKLTIITILLLDENVL